ncbi:MAG TPA: hypothetical protein VGN07_14210 [Steroidobacteraceae bacterium]|jgi:uncharacterized membrane protein
MLCRCSPVIFWAALVLLSGCERKPAETPAQPAAATEPPVTTTPTTPAQPADSSLAIKRGVITAGEHPIFRACDGHVDLWVIDESEGALTQLFSEGAKSVYAEVYGERTIIPQDVPAAHSYPGAFVLEQLLYAGNVSEVKGCEVAAPSDVVSARGNEPSWAVQVTDTQMVWKQPSAPQEITLGGLQSQDAEGTVSYNASGDGHEVELLIDAQPCRDSMSGEFFGFAARAKLDGKEFKGCARVGR